MIFNTDISRDETKRIAILRWSFFSFHCTGQPSTRLMRAVRCPSAHASTSKREINTLRDEDFVRSTMDNYSLDPARFLGSGIVATSKFPLTSVGRLRLHLIAARESQPDPVTKLSGSWVIAKHSGALGQRPNWWPWQFMDWPGLLRQEHDDPWLRHLGLGLSLLYTLYSVGPLKRSSNFSHFPFSFRVPSLLRCGPGYY